MGRLYNVHAGLAGAFIQQMSLTTRKSYTIVRSTYNTDKDISSLGKQSREMPRRQQSAEIFFFTFWEIRFF